MFAPLVLILALAQAAPSVGGLTRQAQQDFQAQRYSEARARLKEALKADPRDPALWSYLGLAEAELNEIDSALADFEKSLALAPNNPQTCFNLGLLYRRKGNAAQALEMYRRGLRLDPSDPGANQNYALLLMEAGRYRDALGPLRKLRAQDENNLPVRVSLIECYLKTGMKPEATAEIKAFQSVAPADELKLAKVLREDQQADAAREVLEHVITVLPDSAEAHGMLGSILYTQNQLEDAARELGRAAQLSPDSAEYSLGLADVLMLWKHYSTAIDFLKAVQDRFGTLPEYRYELALAYYGASDYSLAIQKLQDLAQEQPALAQVQYFLGNSYSAVGSYNKAEAYYQRAIELNPRNASYYTSLASLIRKESAHRTDEAMADLQKALTLDAADVQAKLELALCYEAKSDYPKAQTLLEETVRQEPKLLPAHVALARVYYREKMKAKGNREKAIVAGLESEQQSEQSQLGRPPSPPTPP